MEADSSNTQLEKLPQESGLQYQIVRRLLKKPLCLQNLGFFCAVFCGFCYSVIGVVVKWLKDKEAPLQLSFFATSGLLLTTLTACIITKQHPFPKNERICLLSRALLGAPSIPCYYEAFRLLPIGDASAILNAPIFVIILGRIFFKEEYGLFHGMILLLSTAGVVCISRPSFIFGGEPLNPLGLMYALIGILLISGYILLSRKCKHLSFPVVDVSYSVIGAIMCGVTSAVKGTFQVPYDMESALLILGLMILYCSANLLIKTALELEHAGVVSIGRMTDVVFAFIWQYFIFSESSETLSVVGAALVACSIISLGVHKYIQDKQLCNCFITMLSLS